jgi:hypothetical protein
LADPVTVVDDALGERAVITANGDGLYRVECRVRWSTTPTDGQQVKLTTLI